MRRPAVAFVLAIVLPVLAAQHAWAQNPRTGSGVRPMCRTGCGNNPPWIVLGAPAGYATVFTPTPYIEIHFCRNSNPLDPSSADIKLNGVDKTSSFTYTTGDPGGLCGVAFSDNAYSTSSSVTLSAGANTLYAYICDNGGLQEEEDDEQYGPHDRSAPDDRSAPLCASQSWTLTYIPLVTPSGPIIARDQCLTIAAGPSAAYECADLRIVHALPAVRTLGKVRAPTLLYNSQHAHPFVFLTSDVTLAVNAADSILAIARLRIAGSFVPVDSERWSAAAWGGGGQPVTRRVMTTFATTLSTGIYAYQLEIGKRTSGSYTAIRTDTGSVIVVNRSGSAFGAGWWLAGFEQLMAQTDGSLLWIGGDGDARRYVNAGTWSGKTWYVARQLDRPDTLAFDQTTYTRLLRGGGRVLFNSSGFHTQTIDRLGYATQFAPDANSRLSSITVPPTGSGLTYYFDYNGANSTLSAVRAPDTLPDANYRTTTIGTTGSRIRSITDPAGDSVQFGYANGTYNALITSRTDRRGNATSFTYGTGLKLEGSSLPVPGAATITRAFCPAEVHVWDCGGLTSPDSTYTVYDGPRTDSSDVTHYWLDSLGAISKIRDPYQYITTIARGDTRWPTLATQVRAPNGRNVAAVYDSRGNLITVTDSSKYAPGAHATTSYAWDGVWDQLTQITAATGEVTQFGVSPYNGNRLWVQDGRGSPSRTTFGYVTSGNGVALVDTVTVPGGARTTLTYSAVGNMASSSSPLGWTTNFSTDRLGRLTATRRPLGPTPGSGTFRVDTTKYDARNRAIWEASFGPGTTWAAPESLTVRNFWDAEGNLYRVERSQAPNPTNVSTLVTQWVFDAAGRPTVEIAPDLYRDSTWYDPAGNVIRTLSRNAKVDSLWYDRMNRLRRRVAQGVTYAARSSRLDSLQLDSAGVHTTPFFPNYGTGWRIDAVTDTFVYNSVGQLTVADNADARVRRAYFNDGNVYTDTLSIRNYGDTTFSHVYVLRYRYDLSGRLLVLKHPSQLAAGAGMRDSVQYAYDAVTGALAHAYTLLGNSVDFTYDLRDELIRVGLPGAVQDTLVYDLEGRLTRERVASGGTILTNDSIQYVDPVHASWMGNGAGLLDTAQMAYSGLGHLVGLNYWRPRNDQLGAFQAAITTTLSFFDPMGNNDSTSSGGVFPGDYLITGTGTGSSYDPATGRIVTNRSSSAWHNFAYDSTGNTVFTGQSNGSNLNDRASFYGGDGRLRAAELRFGQVSGGIANYQVTFEEYRYDALGRRVLVMERRSCHDNGLSSQHRDCQQSRVRRTVWDGPRELWEIQMPARPMDGALVENDTASVQYPVGTDQYYNYEDPNRLFGRLAYAYAGGVDQPVMITRLNLVRRKSGESTYIRWNPIELAPHWNWRGQADFGTFADGSTYTCADSTHCALVQWRNRAFALGLEDERRSYPQNGSQFDGWPVGWFGGLINDKVDGTWTHYRRNRYVDPTTGRFTQEDPAGLAGGLNLYGFASGDPVNFSDPFGLCPTGQVCRRYILGHLSRIEPGVTEGSTVHIAQLLGETGSTGHSTGPHLHYEEGAVSAQGVYTADGSAVVTTADKCPIADCSHVTSGPAASRTVTVDGVTTTRPHQGTDISAQKGTLTSVPAALDGGQVVRSGWQNDRNHKEGFGQRITIDVPVPR